MCNHMSAGNNSKYATVSVLTVCLDMFESHPVILLDCCVTQSLFSTPLFQGSRKAAFSSSIPFTCPLPSPFYRSVQTVQSQPLFSQPILLSLIEHYQILLAGEEKKIETKDHVALITKKFIFPHSASWGVGYGFTAGEVLFCKRLLIEYK